MDILKPDEIADREPLMGGSLDLDALDMLELALCIEEVFGVTIASEDGTPRAFTSIGNLANFIQEQTQTRHALRRSPVEAQITFEGLTLPSLT